MPLSDIRSDLWLVATVRRPANGSDCYLHFKRYNEPSESSKKTACLCNPSCSKIDDLGLRFAVVGLHLSLQAIRSYIL